MAAQPTGAKDGYDIARLRPASHRPGTGPSDPFLERLRRRAVRSLLEVAQLREELQDLLGDALARARKRRDRPLTHLIEAALLADGDLGDEADAAGRAILQIDVLWSCAGGGA